MATGTLGTSAKDYPAREQKLVYPLTVASIGSGVSVKAGTLPAGAAMLRCYTVTGTAFNSSTTNNISVGSAAGGAQIVAANAIGAAGINSQTIVAAQAGPLAADTNIWLTGTFAAAAPTAGNALFVLEYATPSA